MAISFTKNGAREHREGLVVRFYPAASEPWVGNFIGGETACNIVVDHPNEAYVIVVAQGEACIVDPDALPSSIVWRGILIRLFRFRRLGWSYFNV